ncbi:MAG: Glyoxalase/bleomycin resistance protein/dioxygenase [Caulobacteraceae bacterium]|nr:MAG: Glyoxalase/bleomycin resistance protein/dioxygenase [Caulobacteraceae bacterium]
MSHIGAFTLLVRDYDEAIAFYVGALGFTLLEDTALSADKRWVRVAPNGGGVAPNGGGVALLLAKASTPEQIARIGDQTGGRVGFFLHTDDFARDHAAFVAKGVRFLEEPRSESYGKVAVFSDLYGAKWDLIGP